MPTQPALEARARFEEASRCFIEAQQRCLCCQEPDALRKSVREARVEYYCKACDFYTCYEGKTQIYLAHPNEEWAEEFTWPILPFFVPTPTPASV